MLSLKPEHIKRYKDVALLLYRYGRGDIAKRAGLADLMPDDREEGARVPGGEKLADDLEKLGPTFIKLGQLLSTRPDIVPASYADALKRLQDHCEPFPYADVEKTLVDELGVRLSKAFQHIDVKPVAAASLSQVHRAVLRDGREVALKVQRPGIREQVMTDLEAMDDVAELLAAHTEFAQRYGIVPMLEEFRKSLLRELDFRQEAMHLLTIGQNLKDVPEIVIPQPLLPYTTSRLLTMEFVSGTKLTALSPVVMTELDGERLADALFRAYLKQMLKDGVFHADPHPGNVFLVDGKLALIDLGMVARIPPSLQDHLLQLLLAVADNRPDDAARTLLAMGESLDNVDEPGFRRAITDLIAQHHETTFQEPQVGRAVLLMLKVAAEKGIRLPPELALIGKTLLNLDEIGHTLAPRFDPNAAIRRHAAEITQQQMTGNFSLGSLFSTAVDLKNFVQQLPGRVNRILDHLADNRFKVQVDAIDEARLMEGMQKVANRICLGLVLAALIVGAALLMRVETTFQIFGYPGLAILLFLAAAAVGLTLVVVILMSDIKASRRIKT